MKITTILFTACLVASCASTDEAYSKAKRLNYEAMPASENILTAVTSKIKSTLKDPDSLKNLTITNTYKCYASKMAMSDNVSPKYDYGYWCYNFSYQATNSYGGYVPGSKFAIYVKGDLKLINELNETVRKYDDVGVWESPTPTL